MGTELHSWVWWDMVPFSFHISYQISHQITCKVYTLHPVLHLLTHPRSQPIRKAWLLHQDGLVSPLFVKGALSSSFPIASSRSPVCELPIFIFFFFPHYTFLSVFICSYTHLSILAWFSHNQHLKFCSLFPAFLSSSLHYFFPLVLIG